MNGVLFVDKPAGITSHDVVAVIRRAVRSRRVGHAGTLDPFATGLLVVAVGQCTRLLPYINGEPKVYDATIAFGTETNTDDSTGIPTREASFPDPSRMAPAIAALTGTLQQVPPSFSAKQVDGQRAYAVARKGGELALAPVTVQVFGWELRGQRDDAIDVRITCAGGTYIRALARDLGRAIGSAAHCATLRRVASGAAAVEQAIPLAELTPGSVTDGRIALRNPRELLQEMTHVALTPEMRRALTFGRAMDAHEPGARAALIDGDEVVAIAERTDDNRWQPRVVLQLESAEPAA
jgi:tRNA pseudouridine55 synthase